jgi:hypothetical protein
MAVYYEILKDKYSKTKYSVLATVAISEFKYRFVDLMLSVSRQVILTSIHSHWEEKMMRFVQNFEVKTQMVVAS